MKDLISHNDPINVILWLRKQCRNGKCERMCMTSEFDARFLCDKVILAIHEVVEDLDGVIF